MLSEETYSRLKNIAATMPVLGNEIPMKAETHLWLGRLSAIIHDMGMVVEGVHLRSSIDRLTSNVSGIREAAAQKIQSILFMGLAHAELRAPAQAQGAFIAVGSTFDSFAAIGRVLAEANTTAMIVDPYMDANALTDFAVLAGPTVAIELLADASAKKAALVPAVQAWKAQYVTERRLDARLAPKGQLHDRLIILDRNTVWVLTQSFNAIAARSPATITKIDAETAALKLPAYEAIWNAATPI